MQYIPQTILVAPEEKQIERLGHLSMTTLIGVLENCAIINTVHTSSGGCDYSVIS